MDTVSIFVPCYNLTNIHKIKFNKIRYFRVNNSILETFYSKYTQRRFFFIENFCKSESHSRRKLLTSIYMRLSARIEAKIFHNFCVQNMDKNKKNIAYINMLNKIYKYKENT